MNSFVDDGYHKRLHPAAAGVDGMYRVGTAPSIRLGAAWWLPAFGMNWILDSKRPQHPGMKQGPRASRTGGLNLRPKPLALLQLREQPRSLARQQCGLEHLQGRCRLAESAVLSPFEGIAAPQGGAWGGSIQPLLHELRRAHRWVELVSGEADALVQFSRWRVA